VKAPIGVFDSGVGGLSILQALQRELPQENFVYIADSAYAPYGERDAAFVQSRSKALWHTLRYEHHAKTLVVACNTATALAIQQLRDDHPEIAFFWRRACGETCRGFEPNKARRRDGHACHLGQRKICTVDTKLG